MESNRHRETRDIGSILPKAYIRCKRLGASLVRFIERIFWLCQIVSRTCGVILSFSKWVIRLQVFAFTGFKLVYCVFHCQYPLIKKKSTRPVRPKVHVCFHMISPLVELSRGPDITDWRSISSDRCPLALCRTRRSGRRRTFSTASSAARWSSNWIPASTTAVCHHRWGGGCQVPMDYEVWLWIMVCHHLRGGAALDGIGIPARRKSSIAYRECFGQVGWKTGWSQTMTRSDRQCPLALVDGFQCGSHHQGCFHVNLPLSSISKPRFFLKLGDNGLTRLAFVISFPP